ncbi:MAG: DUF2723 domain-containing protein [archaeon]|nr:DUF2723 domain-containing protein [archaeon]
MAKEQDSNDDDNDENEDSESDDEPSDSSTVAPRRWALGENLSALLLFAAWLILYTATSYVSVPGGDAGELIVSAHQLGTAHPPGYPTWTLLGHLFSRLTSFLPDKSVVWCVGLSSALCSALSGVFVLKTVALLTGGGWTAGLLAAGLLLCSPQVWTYSTHAEVFPLNNLFVAALLYATARWDAIFRRYQQRGQRFADASRVLSATKASAFLCGLGMSNQHTFVVFMVPTVAVVGIRAFRLLTRRFSTLLSLAAFFLLGMAPYLYLPLSQMPVKPYSWGDTSTLGGIADLFLRRDYGTFRLHSSFDSEPLSARLLLFLGELSASSLHLGVPLALIGLLVLFRRTPTAAVAYALSMALYLFGFLSLCNMPTDTPLTLGVMLRFFMQPNVACFVWIGVGIHALASCVFARRLSSTSPNATRLFSLSAVVLILAIAVAISYPKFDCSESHVLSTYAHDQLAGIPEGAILLLTGDVVVNTLQYLHICEGVRPDLSLLSVEHMTYSWWARYHHLYPNVSFPNERYHPFAPNGFSMLDFLDANYRHRPIFSIGGTRRDDPSMKDKYKEVRVGYNLHRIFRLSDAPQGVQLFRLVSSLRPSLHIFPDEKAVAFPAESWEIEILRLAHEGYGKLAYDILSAALQAQDTSDKAVTISMFEMVVELMNEVIPNTVEGPSSSSHYLNLGIAYHSLSQLTGTDEAYRVPWLHAWERYLTFPSSADNSKTYDLVLKNVKTLRSL